MPMNPLNSILLQRIFDKLDANNDGLVSVDELAWFLSNIGVYADRDELELLVGKGSLDPIEFLFFYETLTEGSTANNKKGRDEEEDMLENDLRKAFKVFDLNDDGYISCNELEIALSRLGLFDEVCSARRDCKSMIDVYDVNSDGLLDFEEFKDMMLL